jgi:hypothetical protein
MRQAIWYLTSYLVETHGPMEDRAPEPSTTSKCSRRKIRNLMEVRVRENDAIVQTPAGEADANKRRTGKVDQHAGRIRAPITILIGLPRHLGQEAAGQHRLCGQPDLKLRETRGLVHWLPVGLYRDRTRIPQGAVARRIERHPQVSAHHIGDTLGILQIIRG